MRVEGALGARALPRLRPTLRRDGFEGEVPSWWYGQVVAVERHGPGIRPKCPGCGLVKGIGWFDAEGHLVQADPRPGDPFVDGYCSEECKAPPPWEAL